MHTSCTYILCRTALHVVAKTGDVTMAQILIQNGADLNMKSVHGFTALYVAAVSNNEGILRLLASQPCVDVDALDLGGMSPLIAATCNGCDLVCCYMMKFDEI